MKKLISLFLSLTLFIGILQPLFIDKVFAEESMPHDYAIKLTYSDKGYVGGYCNINFNSNNLKTDKSYAVKVEKISENCFVSQVYENTYFTYKSLQYSYSSLLKNKGEYKFILNMYESPLDKNPISEGNIVVTRKIIVKVFDKYRPFLSYDCEYSNDETVFIVGETYDCNIYVDNFDDKDDLSNIFDDTGEYRLVYNVPQGTKVYKKVDSIYKQYSLSLSYKFADETKKDFSFKLYKKDTLIDEISYSITPKPEITDTPVVKINYPKAVDFGKNSFVQIYIQNVRRDQKIEIPEFKDLNIYNYDEIYLSSAYTRIFYINLPFMTKPVIENLTVNILESSNQGSAIKLTQKLDLKINLTNSPKINYIAPSKSKFDNTFSVQTNLNNYNRSLETEYKFVSDIKITKGANLVSIIKNTKNGNSTSTTFKAVSSGTIEVLASYKIMYNDYYQYFNEEPLFVTYKKFTIKIEPQIKWSSKNGKKYCYYNNKLKKQSWLDFDGNKYYFDTKGVMLTNSWVKTNGKYYFVDSKGKMKKNSWIKYKDNYYYVDSKGVKIYNTSKKIGSKTYKFDKSGKCINKK